MASLQDVRNQMTWARSSSRRWLDAVDSFTDPGERAALELVRNQLGGRPVLDLGVGTGRTIPLLVPLTTEYLGVDYLQAMVDACRARHPTVSVELGDARRLVDIDAGRFGLVNFSFNGIDAVDHDDRRRVLDEMHRVVAEDGVVVFSTLNIHGPAFRERPWAPVIATSRNPIKRALRHGRAWAGVPIDVWRWATLRNHAQEGEGWALSPISAHHYGVLAHFTSLERQLEELAAARLDRDVVVFDSRDGARVTPSHDTSSSTWFHIIARKR
jgi:SAM-dependent methyltransferase